MSPPEMSEEMVEAVEIIRQARLFVASAVVVLHGTRLSQEAETLTVAIDEFLRAHGVEVD